MDSERFQRLTVDKTVLKIQTIGVGYFKDKYDTIAIQFIFCHPRLGLTRGSDHDARIQFSLFPLENLIPEVSPYPIIDTVLIMANADAQAYALTYRISIDYQQRQVHIIVEDQPEVGESLGSEEERNGITIPY